VSALRRISGYERVAGPASDSSVSENQVDDHICRGFAMKSMDWSAQVGDGSTNYQEFLVPGMFTPFAGRLIADLKITRGSAVLDVACGTGVVTRLAARATGTTGTVTGIDIGPSMLAVARSQPAEPDSASIIFRASGVADRRFRFAARVSRLTCSRRWGVDCRKPTETRPANDAAQSATPAGQPQGVNLTVITSPSLIR